MVTAELAVAIPSVVLLLALCLSALRLGMDSVAATDGARVAARALARGDRPPVAVALAQRAAPGSTVTVDRLGDEVVVGVRLPAPALLGRLGVRGAAAHVRIPVEGLVERPSGGPP